MREIKFRIWDSNLRLFHYWGFINGNFVGLPSNNKNPKSITELQEESEQYTGLKDKNGKEIYEGDIIRWQGKKKKREHSNGYKTTIMHELAYQYVVSFENGAFGYKLGQDFQKDLAKIMEKRKPDKYNWEIIGNTYEASHYAYISHLKARRYAREKGAIGSHTLEEWNNLKIEFNNKCAFCRRKKKLTKDHIIPLGEDGTDYIDNIQPLCRNCNSKKWKHIYENKNFLKGE